MNKVIIFLSLIGISSAGIAQNGVLDSSFGNAGIVMTSIGQLDRGHNIAVQADGKLLITAFHQNTPGMLALLRYETDGTLDVSFGTGGIVTIPFNVVANSSSTQNYSIVVQSDGKILVAGDSQGNTTVDFTVFRFNSNGSLDTDFDTDGKVQINFGAFTSSSATSIGLQSDGKIILGGYASTSGNSDFAAARLTPNGSLDPGFDTDGKVVIPVGDFTDRSYAMALQNDGKILLGGSALGNIITEFALIRLTTNGSIDLSFDTDGKVITPFDTHGNEIKDIRIQSDGKIVVTGNSYGTLNGGFANNFVLVRYETDGNLDSSFGTNGKVLTNIGGSNDNDFSNALWVQPDGKIICGGTSSSALAIPQFALARYDTNGLLDETFGNAGKTITAIEDGAFGSDIVMQNDGKIIVVGNSSNNNTNKTSIALARYITGVVLTIDHLKVLGIEMLLYPNPSKGLFQLEFNLNKPAELDFRITDISGKEITLIPSIAHFEACKNRYSFSLPSNLPGGNYFLTIVSPDTIRTIRFIHSN